MHARTPQAQPYASVLGRWSDEPVGRLLSCRGRLFLRRRRQAATPSQDTLPVGLRPRWSLGRDLSPGALGQNPAVHAIGRLRPTEREPQLAAWACAGLQGCARPLRGPPVDSGACAAVPTITDGGLLKISQSRCAERAAFRSQRARDARQEARPSDGRRGGLVFD